MKDMTLSPGQIHFLSMLHYLVLLCGISYILCGAEILSEFIMERSKLFLTRWNCN